MALRASQLLALLGLFGICERAAGNNGSALLGTFNLKGGPTVLNVNTSKFYDFDIMDQEDFDFDSFSDHEWMAYEFVDALISHQEENCPDGPVIYGHSLLYAESQTLDGIEYFVELELTAWDEETDTDKEFEVYVEAIDYSGSTMFPPENDQDDLGIELLVDDDDIQSLACQLKSNMDDWDDRRLLEKLASHPRPRSLNARFLGRKAYKQAFEQRKRELLAEAQRHAEQAPAHEPAAGRKLVSVPASFDARSKYNCVGHQIQNQGSCGSCWVFAMVAAHEARLCYASEGKINVKMSAQDILSCTDHVGCQGGLPYLGAARMYDNQNGITNRANNDVGFLSSSISTSPDAPCADWGNRLTCQSARAGVEDFCMTYAGNDHIGTASESAKATAWTAKLNAQQEVVARPSVGFAGAQRCGATCEKSATYKGYYFETKSGTSVTVLSSTTGFEDLVKEQVYMHGSVAAGAGWTDELQEFFANNPKGIYAPSQTVAANHAITVIGWGEEAVETAAGTKTVKYFLIQNSHGKEAGDQGYFKVARSVIVDIDIWDPVVPTSLSRTDCKNGVVPDATGKCVCPKGYSGTNCEVCPPCAGGGSRNDASNCQEMCMCTSGRVGPTCAIKVSFDIQTKILSVDKSEDPAAYNEGDLAVIFPPTWVSLTDSQSCALNPIIAAGRLQLAKGLDGETSFTGIPSWFSANAKTLCKEPASGTLTACKEDKLSIHFEGVQGDSLAVCIFKWLGQNEFKRNKGYVANGVPVTPVNTKCAKTLSCGVESSLPPCAAAVTPVYVGSDGCAACPACQLKSTPKETTTVRYSFGLGAKDTLTAAQQATVSTKLCDKLGQTHCSFAKVLSMARNGGDDSLLDVTLSIQVPAKQTTSAVITKAKALTWSEADLDSSISITAAKPGSAPSASKLSGSCKNGIKDVDEADVDCGSLSKTTCGGCADGKKCSAGADCVTGTCTGGVCGSEMLKEDSATTSACASARIMGASILAAFIMQMLSYA